MNMDLGGPGSLFRTKRDSMLKSANLLYQAAIPPFEGAIVYGSGGCGVED